MKKNKRGFTLIELLAVIVIIAIIAVITVPIVLNIIEQSKKGTAKDSAYGYVESVNRLYYSKSLKDEDDVEDGIYTVSELKTIGVSIAGSEPSDGWVELENNEVVSYSLKFGDYVITKYRDTDVVVKHTDIIGLTPNEALSAAIIESLGGVEKSDGAYYIIDDDVEVYFDPTTNGLCNSGSSSSIVGTTTGCMHWYLYSIKGDYANLLLDHNITEENSNDGAWALSVDYVENLTPIVEGQVIVGYEMVEGQDFKATNAGITYPGITSFGHPNYTGAARGPITALNTLKTLTTNWKTGTPKVPNSLSINEYIIPASANDNKYQIDYTGYHARLITSEELEYLGCLSQDLRCTTSWSGFSGTYWTSSSQGDTHAWVISSKGYGGYAAGDVRLGVRPVITVNIADIADQLS